MTMSLLWCWWTGTANPIVVCDYLFEEEEEEEEEEDEEEDAD